MKRITKKAKATKKRAMKVKISYKPQEAMKVTEEMGVHKNWYIEAKGITQEKLPAFVNRLAKDYDHDYGTICHAMAAAAVAAAWVVNRGPQGGITGFQAGAVAVEFCHNFNPSFLEVYAKKIMELETLVKDLAGELQKNGKMPQILAERIQEAERD